MENEAEAQIETPKTEPIDQALLEKMQGLKTLVRLDTLIQNCLFPGGAASDLVAARGFIQALHVPLLNECRAHPDFQRASIAELPTADQEALSKAEAKRLRKLEKV